MNDGKKWWQKTIGYLSVILLWGDPEVRDAFYKGLRDE